MQDASPDQGPKALAPFRTPAFRWQWPADLATAWGLEMETLILGWYVLVESGSVVMLTVFGALMYVGTLLSPLIGTLGDRIGLGRLLAAMRLFYALLACTILLMALTGHLRPGTVLVVAFLVGLVKPSDIGMRTALASATVPPAQLVAAVGISRTTQDSARIGGALAGAGFMAGLGMVMAYGLIAGLYLLAAALTLRAGSRTVQVVDAVRAHPPVQSLHSVQSAAKAAVQRGSPWHDLKEGLLHVWHTPRLRAAMALAALVNLCAFPLTGGLMPYVARDVFGLDQQGLGWLVASWATGALLGSMAMGVWGSRLPLGRTMLVTCALWYCSLLALALPLALPLATGTGPDTGAGAGPGTGSGVGVAMALFVLGGMLQSLSMVALSLILLRSSEDRFRGRVMGVRMLAIYTLPIGLLAAGALIPIIGFAGLVLLYVGFGLLMLGALSWAWREHLWRHDASAHGV